MAKRLEGQRRIEPGSLHRRPERPLSEAAPEDASPRTDEDQFAAVGAGPVGGEMSSQLVDQETVAQ